MTDTSAIRSIAREVAKEVAEEVAEKTAEKAVRDHQTMCPTTAALQASLDALQTTVNSGFQQVNAALESQRKDLAGALNVSGRHSERLKSLERKRKGTTKDEDSALVPTVGTGRSSDKDDGDEKPLVSQRLINNLILAAVVAVATGFGNWAWGRLVPPTPEPAATIRDPRPASSPVHQPVDKPLTDKTTVVLSNP